MSSTALCVPREEKLWFVQFRFVQEADSQSLFSCSCIRQSLCISSALCGSLDTWASSFCMQISVCFEDIFPLWPAYWTGWGSDYRGIQWVLSTHRYFFRQEWPPEFGAIKCSYCVYSVRGQFVLPRSHILRLVVNLFGLLILCSGTQMAYPPGISDCMRLSGKIWLNWVLVLHQSPLQVSMSAQAQCLIMEKIQLQWNRVTTWDRPFFILISSNESISGIENNSFEAMKFI